MVLPEIFHIAAPAEAQTRHAGRRRMLSIAADAFRGWRLLRQFTLQPLPFFSAFRRLPLLLL
jgi:hypothetical protein